MNVINLHTQILYLWFFRACLQIASLKESKIVGDWIESIRKEAKKWGVQEKAWWDKGKKGEGEIGIGNERIRGIKEKKGRRK